MSELNGFTQNADLYRTSKAHSELSDLEAVTEHLGPLAGKDCLDIATGTGHTALFLAQKHAHVFAVDINDEMLRVAQEEADRLTLSVRFLKSSAEELMFDDDNFDLVTCRLAAHHFRSVNDFLAEAARVLRSAGQLLVIDNVVPEDQDTAVWLNELEAARDGTHQECLSVSDWSTAFEQHDFKLVYSEEFSKVLDYKAWMDRMSMEPDAQDDMWNRLMNGPVQVRSFWKPTEDSKGTKSLTLRRQIMLAQLS